MFLVYYINKIHTSLFISVTFMYSRDGESLMRLGDFTFTRQLYVENKWCWSCYTHNDNGCPARVYTDLNKLIYAKNYHNHPPTEFFVWLWLIFLLLFFLVRMIVNIFYILKRVGCFEIFLDTLLYSFLNSKSILYIYWYLNNLCKLSAIYIFLFLETRID